MIDIKSQIEALDRLTKFYDNTGDQRAVETKQQADLMRSQLQVETVAEVTPEKPKAKRKK